ncbi:MAG: lipase maturation factor family protein [Phycisphaerae bacterium]|nr:lipase maturation factor family protein [Phycisphaerae bacterium]
MTGHDRPVMIYDGDCDFCRSWIARWQALSGDRIDYAAFQHVAERFPQISADEFRREVKLVEPDGTVYGGAAAVYRALRDVPGRGWLERAYQRVPGFALLSDLAYRWIADHRPLLSRVTLRLWGGAPNDSTYHLARSYFLRGLGVVYLFAFVSLLVQMPGLIGRQGILPAAEFIEAVRDHLGPSGFWRLPTLCWWASGDGFLSALAWIGVVAAALLIAGVLPRMVLAVLWIAYLSLVNVSQDFLGFQWDALLLEAGFLAILVAPRSGFMRAGLDPAPSRITFWLLHWLLFRLMFLSGITKLTYNDPTWLNLSALEYHYQTQPLPTWIGWYAHQLPGWFQRLSVAVMFIIELLLPFHVFGPRRMKQIAFTGFVLLQALIAATGNYAFFNLLTVVLCIPLLDDRALGRLTATSTQQRLATAPPMVSFAARWRRITLGPVFAVIFIASTLEGIEEIFGRGSLPRVAEAALAPLRPFRSINGYGLFRVMTTGRPEIVLQGSRDGLHWQAYEFRWKPGDVRRRPGFVEPHQPRLDWQMWFAALRAPNHPPWFVRFVRRVLDGSPDVLHLLGTNPFPDSPPQYLRAQLYQYRFTTIEERRKTGEWWHRERIGDYLPVVSLRGR